MPTPITTKEFNRLSRAKRAVIIAKDVIQQIELGFYGAANGYETYILTAKGRQKLERDPGVQSPYGQDERQGTFTDYNKVDASTFIKEAKKGEIKCTGCARANLFISSVKFKNVLTLNDVHAVGGAIGFSYHPDDYGDTERAGKATTYMSAEFPPKQQALIESAYEMMRFGQELAEKNEDYDSWGDENDDEKDKKKYTAKGRKFLAELDKAIDYGNKYFKKFKEMDKKERKALKMTSRDYILVAICKNIIRNNGVFKP